jgi:hypothetical protein
MPDVTVPSTNTGPNIPTFDVYGLYDQGVGVRVPVGVKFSLLHVVQTDSGAHPASYPMGNGVSVSGVKTAGA